MTSVTVVSGMHQSAGFRFGSDHDPFGHSGRGLEALGRSQAEIAKLLEGFVVVETCQVGELEFLGTLGDDEVDRGPRRQLDPRQGGLLDDLAGRGFGIGTRRHGSHGQAGFLDRRLGLLLGHADDVGDQHRFGPGRDVHEDRLVLARSSVPPAESC